MKTKRTRPPKNFTSFICNAIIRGDAPENCYLWPVVEVLRTTVLRGGGESTSYHGMVTVRESGTQVWRGTEYEFSLREAELITGLVKIGQQQQSAIYVRSPVS